MLSDLTTEQQELACYMSELSEAAFHAGWIEGLEYSIWEAMNGSLSTYGRLTITDDHRRRLHELSERVEGWIVFDDRQEETFVPMASWKTVAERRKVPK